MKTKSEQVEELKAEVERLKRQVYSMKEGHYIVNDMSERIPMYHVEVTDWGSGSMGTIRGRVFTTDVMVAKVVQMSLSNLFPQFRTTVSRKKDVNNDDDNTYTTI